MTSRSRRCWSGRGLSLIEVLVAIGIVAVALTAGMAASGALTRQAERQPDMLLAQLCAQNELAALQLSRQLPAVGDKVSRCEQAGVQLQITLRVSPAADARFRQVHAEVSRQGLTLLGLSTVLGR